MENQSNNDDPTVGFGLLGEIVTIQHEGERGTLRGHLEDAIKAASRAANKFGKSASVSFKITFNPLGNDELEIGASMTVKKPEPKAAPVRLYATKDGDLIADDPNQATLSGFDAARARRKGGDR